MAGGSIVDRHRDAAGRPPSRTASRLRSHFLWQPTRVSRCPAVRAVCVSGNSMVPTLRDGDACLVLWGAAPRAGDVVVARLPGRGLGVKRAAFVEPDGAWWLRSDNVTSGTDSATFGSVPSGDVLGRVVVRYWPRPAWIRRVS
nr:S24/S26 family peptidase [Frankia sp. Cppng1_Ct_nod]